MNNTIVIIDPFTSAKYLSNELKKAGFYTVAIFTKPKEQLHGYFLPEEDLFDKQIYLDLPETETLIATVKKHHPNFVINGTESATQLTDTITTALLPNLANNPENSHFRSNKFFMQEKLKENGLPFIKQQMINIRDLNTSNLDSMDFPCFCKPVNGICTIGAFKANNQQELLEKLPAILRNETDIFNNSEYLIQQYIEGEEYYIDTFSYQGKHYISSVGKYTKELMNDSPVYRSFKIVESKEIWDKCSAFVKQCLDATEFKNGFAHTEIFLTRSGDIYLIEINPRISGLKGYCNLLATSVKLKSQIDLLIECLTQKLIQESSLDDKIGYSKGLALFNFSEHPLKDPKAVLETIPSVSSYQLIKSVGSTETNENKTLADVDLIVLLKNRDKVILENDANTLYSLEKAGKLM